MKFPDFENIDPKLENDPTEKIDWERTLAYDEVMTASRLGPTKTFSGLTFAILKDCGWYKVNDSYEEKFR